MENKTQSDAAPHELRQVKVADYTLEYYWTGPRIGRGPVLVFLHEGLGSAGLWHDFPHQLAHVTRLPALVYSRYGYGGSDVLRSERTPEYMHHEALHLLPALRHVFELDDVILVGHSDGASIALIHAGDGRWPVRALALEAPHVFVEDITISQIETLAEAYRDSGLRQRIARHHTDGDRTFWGWNRIWLDPRFRTWNIERSLVGIDCPVFAVQGEDDEYGSVRQLEILRERCGGIVETLLLPNCQHAPHRDQGSIVCRRMGEFLQRCLTRRGNATGNR